MTGSPSCAWRAGTPRDFIGNTPASSTPTTDRRVAFSAREPITAVVDGEVMTDTAFTVRLSEKKVNFFYPGGRSYQVEGRRN